MTIRIVGGTAGYHDGKRMVRLTAADGPVTLDPQTEKRWTSMGIAEYVGTSKPIEDPKPETFDDSRILGGYAAMDMASLKAECAQRGIPYKARSSKQDLIALLDESDAEETPPTFDAMSVE